MTSLQLEQKLTGLHSEDIWSLSWCQGNICTGSLDGTVAYYSVAEGRQLFKSNSESIGVTSVVTVQDGSTAIACFQDSKVRFYDLFANKETHCIDPGMMEAYGLSLSPGEDILVSGTLKGHLNVWSMQDEHEKVATLSTESKGVLATSFSLDGKLGTGGMDGHVNVIDVNTQQVVHRLEAHALPVRCVTFSPSGRVLYAASDDRHVSLHDVRSGKLVQSFSHEAMAFSVDASPDGRSFAVGCTNGQVALWDLGLKRKLGRFDAHSEVVWSVQYDKLAGDGGRLASAGDDGVVAVFTR